MVTNYLFFRSAVALYELERPPIVDSFVSAKGAYLQIDTAAYVIHGIFNTRTHQIKPPTLIAEKTDLHIFPLPAPILLPPRPHKNSKFPTSCSHNGLAMPPEFTLAPLANYPNRNC